MAIFALIGAAMASLAVGGFVGLEQGGEHTQAEALAQEGIEAVRSIKDGAYNEIIYNQSAVSTSTGQWVFDGEGTDEIIGQYTRTIIIEDVCRDVTDAITACSGSYTDVHTKKITVTVEWTIRFGFTNSIQRVAFLTNWDSQDWIQTDWSGGSGQTIWSDSTMYDSDDSNIDYSTAGEIKLTSTGSSDACGNKIWSFNTPENYTYNNTEIEITGGSAQLKDQGGGGASGNTLNSGFDADASNWTFNQWLTAGGVTNTGSYVASGGNPGGYVDIFIEGKKGNTLAAFWEQSFTTTVDSPSGTLDLDWIISAFDATKVNSFHLYAFIDSASGSPTVGQEVWDSGNITGVTSWASITQVDISASIPTSGTYYLKIAAWVDYAGGGGAAANDQTIGFDNVIVNWSGSGSCSGTPTVCNFFDEASCPDQDGCSWSGSYPTSSSINPAVSYTATGVDTWSSFSEIATKNGGEISYQLSDDDGSIWQYYNGGWTTAGATDYNTAAEINTNIGSFSTTTGKIMFKAFLTGDGSQQVQLSNVQVGWGELVGSGSGYATSGYFISSAFDMSDSSPVQVVEWDETLPIDSNIQLQVRTAPDSGGSPGTWTSWYGATGAGTYFTNATGTLISTDLNNNQWLQYRAELSGDGTNTPVLEEIKINYK